MLSDEATLVNLALPLITILLRIVRIMFLVVLSHFIGSQQAIKSVANTILYHDGLALATFEPEPLMRVFLPSLGTIG